MKPITLVLVEDDRLLASLLLEWIERQPDWTLIGQPRDGKQGITTCLEKKPDIVLLDVSLPGMDGFAVAKAIRASAPAIRIIMLTCHSDPYTIQRVQEYALEGYVNKTSSLDVLERAVTHVASGGVFYDETFTRSSASLKQPDAVNKILSDREIEVLALVAEGLTDEAIAAMLNISRLTVCTHRRNIRAKMGAHSDRDLVFLARQWGLGATRNRTNAATESPPCETIPAGPRTER